MKYGVDENGRLLGSSEAIGTYAVVTVDPPHGYVKWDFNKNEWIFDSELYKNDLIIYVKSLSEKIITDKKAFPSWKQQNLLSDQTYAVNALSTALGISIDTVMGGVVSKVGLSDDIDYLKSIYNNPSQINIDDLIVPDNQILDINTQIQYYQTIIQSIVAYRLIRHVRVWSDNKEKEIKSKSTKDELDSITFDDHPDINVRDL